MGWLVSDRHLTTETPAQYLTREYSNDSTEYRTEVLAASQVGRAVYLAIRNSHQTGRYAGKTYTYAAIILVFNNAREGFGRKAMDGTAGLYEIDCPARIMALLSPIEEIPDPGYAADWRRRVREAVASRRTVAAAAKRLRPGQRIQITEPLSFNKGAVVTTEFVVSHTPVGRRGPVFTPVGQTFLCRLPKRLLGTAMIVPAQPGPLS